MCFNKEHTSCCQNDVHGTAILCAKTSAAGDGCCIGGARASRIGAPPPIKPGCALDISWLEQTLHREIPVKTAAQNDARPAPTHAQPCLD
eukprot:COSAG01_NODE_2422_length_7726_cov_5.781172_6_plen_90_part_00